MNYQLFVSIVFFISAILLLLIGTVVLRDNPRRRLNRVAGLMLILAGLGPLFAAIGSLFDVGASSARSGSAITGLFYLWELFFPQLILFSVVFPVERPLVKRYSRIKYLIFIPHVFHVILASFFYDPSKIIDWLTVESPPQLLRWFFDQFELGVGLFAAVLSSAVRVHLEFFAVINFVYVLIASVLLYQGYRTVTNERLRTQTAIVIWGIRGALGLYIVGFILPNLGILEIGEMLQSSITIIALIIGAGSIVYAIVRYQFLDIRLIVRQSLVYTVTSGVLVGLYMLVISQLGKITRTILGRDAPLIDVAFIIAALVFFQPIMNQMDNLIKRFFIRDKADFRNMAEQFSHQLATIFDLELLRANVASILRRQMLVERVWFCLHDIPSGFYEASPEPRIDHKAHRFMPEDVLFDELKTHVKPVPFVELSGITMSDSDCWRLLQGDACELIVPLHSDRQMLGFVALSAKVSGYSYNYEDMTTLSILSNQLVTAIANTRLYEESLEKQRLEKEMAMARQIQRDLLPRRLPRGDDFEFAAFTEPARDVGGDYFDFLSADKETIGVVVADASGKGMPAALLVSQLQATLRSEVRFRQSLSQMIASANYLVATSTSPEKFVTLFYAEFDPKNLTLYYCNAGHNYPFVVRRDGSTAFLNTGGLLIGAFMRAKYECERFQLTPGDTVFFYTDGLNEAHDRDGEEYGEERLLEFVRRRRELSPRELTKSIISEVRNFAAGKAAEDDMTVIVLKIFG
jgi:serine phosphatase RsbU (regulator of sigma subunit)